MSESDDNLVRFPAASLDCLHIPPPTRYCYDNCYNCSDEDGKKGYKCEHRTHEWTLRKKIDKLIETNRLDLRPKLEKSCRQFYKRLNFPHMFLFEDPIISIHTNCVAFATRDLLGHWARHCWDTDTVMALIKKVKNVRRKRDGDICIWYKTVEPAEHGMFHFAIIFDGLYMMKDGINGEVSAFKREWVDKAMEERGFTHFKRVRKFKLPYQERLSIVTIRTVKKIEKVIRRCIKERNFKPIIKYFDAVHKSMCERNQYIPNGDHSKEEESLKQAS